MTCVSPKFVFGPASTALQHLESLAPCPVFRGAGALMTAPTPDADEHHRSDTGNAALGCRSGRRPTLAQVRTDLGDCAGVDRSQP